MSDQSPKRRFPTDAQSLSTEQEMIGKGQYQKPLNWIELMTQLLDLRL